MISLLTAIREGHTHRQHDNFIFLLLFYVKRPGFIWLRIETVIKLPKNENSIHVSFMYYTSCGFLATKQTGRKEYGGTKGMHTLHILRV
jgi:hypothetical protein